MDYPGVNGTTFKLKLKKEWFGFPSQFTIKISFRRYLITKSNRKCLLRKRST